MEMLISASLCRCRDDLVGRVREWPAGRRSHNTEEWTELTCPPRKAMCGDCTHFHRQPFSPPVFGWVSPDTQTGYEGSPSAFRPGYWKAVPGDCTLPLLTGGHGAGAGSADHSEGRGSPGMRRLGAGLGTGDVVGGEVLKTKQNQNKKTTPQDSARKGAVFASRCPPGSVTHHVLGARLASLPEGELC